MREVDADPPAVRRRSPRLGGEIRLQGKPVTLDSPTGARALGVATVFQEFSIVPSLTVAENVFLGRWPRRALGLIDWEAMRRRSREVLAELDIALDPDAITSTLSVAQQQLIEIAKAVAADCEAHHPGRADDCAGPGRDCAASHACCAGCARRVMPSSMSRTGSTR